MFLFAQDPSIGQAYGQLEAATGGRTFEVAVIVIAVLGYLYIKKNFNVTKKDAAPPANGTTTNGSTAPAVTVKASPAQPVDLVASVGAIHQQIATHQGEIDKFKELLSGIQSATQAPPPAAASSS